MFVLRDGVGDDQTVDFRVIDSFDCVSRQDGVGDEGVDLGGALFFDEFGGTGDGHGGVGEVVDDDGDFVLEVADEHHGGFAARAGVRAGLNDGVGVGGAVHVVGDFVGPGGDKGWGVVLRVVVGVVDLVDESEFHLEGVGEGGGSLGSSGIGRDNDELVLFGEWNVALDVTLEEGTGVEVVDWDVEESLVLGIMQIHCDDVIGTGTAQQISNQGTSLGNPLSVARVWLVRVVEWVAFSSAERWCGRAVLTSLLLHDSSIL